MLIVLLLLFPRHMQRQHYWHWIKIFAGKKIISAIKGILPEQNLLLNDFLKNEFNFPLEDYFAVLGPCHAEEVAAEKLSYLTFSGIDEAATHEIATYFKTDYLNTIIMIFTEFSLRLF